MGILWFPPRYPITMHLEKYNHVALLLYAVLIPHDHRAHMFVFRRAVLYLCSTTWKAASMMQIFRSGMFHGENAVKEIFVQGVKLPYHSTEDIYFTQRRATVMGPGYAILEFSPS